MNMEMNKMMLAFGDNSDDDDDNDDDYHHNKKQTKNKQLMYDNVIRPRIIIKSI